MARRRIKKGDSVRFRIVSRSVDGVVKEDRGPIGIDGRHLYLVEFRADSLSDEISRVELPAEDLEVAAGAATAD